MLISYMTGKKKSYANNLRGFKDAKDNNWLAPEHNLVNKFTVLYSGNMGLCHDMDTILETAKLLRDEPIQFVCISIGAKRQIFLEEVNDLGLTKFSVSVLLRKKVLPYYLTACNLSLVSVEAEMESLVAPSKLHPLSGRQTDNRDLF